MLFSPIGDLTSITSDDPLDSLLFVSDNLNLLPTTPISHEFCNENRIQQSRLYEHSLRQYDRLPSNLSCIRPAAKLPGPGSGALSLDQPMEDPRPPDTLNQPDQLTSVHESAKDLDEINQELLSQLLNPEFFPTNPAETPASIGNSFISPEIDIPLRFDDIIFGDSDSSGWPRIDPPPFTNTSTTSYDSSVLLNCLNNLDISPPMNNLFDVTASPSLSLAASLINSEVFESPLYQSAPYPTPNPYLLDTFLSGVQPPSLLPGTLPSPMATPAVASVCPGSSASNFAPTPVCLQSADVSSFDLFPSLDEVSSSGVHGADVEQSSFLDANIDVTLLSALSDALKQHEPTLSSSNVTPERILELLQTLAMKPTSSQGDSASVSSALKDVEEETTAESVSTGPIRRVPASSRKRRVTKMYACDYPGCDKAFSRHFNLKAHQKTHDPNRERPFTCELCFKSFIRAHDLMRHQPVHTKVKEFECEACLKRFTRKDAKDRHLLLGKCK